VVPKADPTVAPLGHTEDAVDAVGVAAAAVVEAVVAGPDVVGPVVDPPQPASVPATATAIGRILRQLLPVRWNALRPQLRAGEGPESSTDYHVSMTQM
jgi:hypothetical protein